MYTPDIKPKDIYIRAATTTVGSTNVGGIATAAAQAGIAVAQPLAQLVGGVTEPAYSIHTEGYGPLSTLLSLIGDTSKQLGDILAIQEQITLILTGAISLSEATGMLENLLVSLTKQLIDTTALSETLVSNVSVGLLETLGAVETLKLETATALQDTLAIVDTDFTALLGNFYSLNDLLALTESLIATLNVALTAETLAITESLASDCSKALPAETTTITEPVFVKDYTQLPVETLALTESSRVMLVGYNPVEQLGLIETLANNASVILPLDTTGLIEDFAKVYSQQPLEVLGLISTTQLAIEDYVASGYIDPGYVGTTFNY